MLLPEQSTQRSAADLPAAWRSKPVSFFCNCTLGLTFCVPLCRLESLFQSRRRPLELSESPSRPRLGLVDAPPPPPPPNQTLHPHLLPVSPPPPLRFYNRSLPDPAPRDDVAAIRSESPDPQSPPMVQIPLPPPTCYEPRGAPVSPLLLFRNDVLTGRFPLTGLVRVGRRGVRASGEGEETGLPFCWILCLPLGEFLSWPLFCPPPLELGGLGADVVGHKKCHVLAHESFEDPEIAKYLNENFISVKVDREERPDVDRCARREEEVVRGAKVLMLTRSSGCT